MRQGETPRSDFFNTNVKSVLLYGAETWRYTQGYFEENTGYFEENTDIYQPMSKKDPAEHLSAIKTCGNGHTSFLLKWRSYENDGDG